MSLVTKTSYLDRSVANHAGVAKKPYKVYLWRYITNL